MQLYLETGYESGWATGRWAELASIWQAAGHLTLAASPGQADAILITIADPDRPYAEVVEAIAASSLYRAFRQKCFVFDTQDTPVGYYPGLYSSLRRYLFDPTRHRTGCYMQSFNEFIREASDDEPARDRRWLFSFQGNATSATRARLLGIDFGRPDVLIERTQPFWTDTGSPELRSFKQRYADTISDSKFVLCPRGIGTSSFRLFEALQSGSVPIILSDDWVPVAGLDWEGCSLRVREADVGRLPEICLANEARWPDLAQAAYRTWRTWFSADGLGRLVKASLQDITTTRRLKESVYRLEWPLRTAKAGLRQAAARTLGVLRPHLRANR